jgi:hypothetical protein
MSAPLWHGPAAVMCTMLLAGGVPAPTDAAWAGSLPVGSVVEEIAPGVLHVVNDGVRDLAGWGVTSGRDGSIWLHSSRTYVPLGGQDGLEWPTGQSSGVLFEVAPDGVIWVVEDTPDRPFVRIRSFDGRTWRTHRKTRAESVAGWAIDVAADGIVWAAWPDQEMRDPQRASVVARLAPDGWHFLAAPYRGRLVDLTVTDDGDVWITDLLAGPFRYEDGTWRPAAADASPALAANSRTGGWHETDRLSGAVGRDGTVWLARCGLVEDPLEPVYDCDSVLRRRDGTWTVWSAPDELRDGANVAVAPDGSAWFSPLWPEDGAGLLRFDGSTWTRFLPRRAVYALPGVPAFGAEGRVWVASEPLYGRSSAIHVITPQAYRPG